MKVKQLIELLSQFDPDTTVQIAVSETSWEGQEYRSTCDDIQVVELARYDGMHPLISVCGAHLLEE